MISSEIEKLENLFLDAGYEFYLVGGYVRDLILGKESKDIDVATNATPEQTLQILEGQGFPDPYRQGEKFGTIGIPLEQPIEITTFRADSYDAKTRKPTVEFGESLDEDLSRRDFTINAMAYSPQQDRVIDPYGGTTDLLERVLCTPLNPEISFYDDPLRILRAGRFIARMDLIPDLDLIEAAYKLRERIKIVSKERINDELCKILVAPHTNEAFTFLSLTGALEQIFPNEIINNIEFFTPPILNIRLGELFRSFKYYHDVKQCMTDLKFPNNLIKDVMDIMEEANPPTITPKEIIRKTAANLGTKEKFRQMLALNNAYRKHQSDMYSEAFEELLEEEDIFDVNPPLSGQEIMDHLGLPPGPLVGFFSRTLLDERFVKGELTRREAFVVLDNAAERWFMK